MTGLRLLGGVVAVVLSAAIGVIPAVGDDTGEQRLASGSGSEPEAPAAEQPVPNVPADAGPVIRDALSSSTSSSSRSGVGGSSTTDPASPPATDPPVPDSTTPTPTSTAPTPSIDDGTSEPDSGEVNPARITGLSFVLDLLEFGAELGPHEVHGLIVSALGTVIPTGELPPALVDQAYTILAVPSDVFEQMAEPTMQGFAALRAALEPLSAANEAANMLIQALSDALIAAGTEGAALTNPLDAQVVQVGKFLLVLQEAA